MGQFHYQVGGSLTRQAPSYVTRQADEDLYEALHRGEFCYVLNSRQMGKSSLLVQTKHRLQEEGHYCVVLDMTNIGSENITPLQWYKGVIKDLWRSVKPLRQFKFKQWWQAEDDISLLQRLSRFIGDVLLPGLPDQNIVIFIDEIDSILSLKFSVDDFFALIRFCYNQRAIDSNYERLNFAIFGVATPADLIRDRSRTPFNLGTAISLSGFTLEEARPLTHGLSIANANTEAILNAILDWTNGQPFLTQKLCQIVIRAAQHAPEGQLTIPPGQENYWVEILVQQYILQDWETQDEPEHLRTIQNRLLGDTDTASRLLGLYQRVLDTSSKSELTHWDRNTQGDKMLGATAESIDLILSGLVIKKGAGLQIKNRIYAEIFSQDWVNYQLRQLRPYSQFLEAWVNSNYQDESRLLRGQALRDAQNWSQGKQLSDADYQFLAASVDCDRRQVQQALEAERSTAIADQLAQEQKTTHLQRWSLRTLSIAFFCSIGLAVTAFWQYRAARDREQLAKESEIKALISSASGNFDSHAELESMKDILKAQLVLNQTQNVDPQIQQKLQRTFHKISDQIAEFNRIKVGPGLKTFDIHPSGKLIITSSESGQIKLWTDQGTFIKQIPNAHTADVNDLRFSPDGKTFLSASSDGTIKLWTDNGDFKRTLVQDKTEFQVAQFSPDGKMIAANSSDHSFRLWSAQGKFIRSLPLALKFSWSPNSQMLAVQTRSLKTGLQLIDLEGKTIRGIPSLFPAYTMSFSPDGQIIAQAAVNKTVMLWSLEGQLIKILRGHESSVVRDVTFSADGNYIASVSADKTVKVWQTPLGEKIFQDSVNSSVSRDHPIARRPRLPEGNGSLIRTLRGHQATVRTVKFSPDGTWLISASDDGTLRFWKPFHPLQSNLLGHTDFVSTLALSQDGQTLISASTNQMIRIWQRNASGLFSNQNVATLYGHYRAIRDVKIHPKGQQFATSARTGIELWTLQGKRLQSFPATVDVNDLAYSPDGRWLAAALENKTVHLRRRVVPTHQPLPHKTHIAYAEKPSMVLTGHQGPVQSVAFHPDGKTLVTSSGDRLIKLWDWNEATQTFVLSQTLKGHDTEVRTAIFNPKGTLIASASVDNKIKLWARDGTLIRTLEGHQGSVWDLAFSPTGEQLASSSMDGTVKLWDLNGQMIREFHQHSSAVRNVLFSPDGETLISAGDDQVVRLWQLKSMLSGDEQAWACQWVADYLKAKEVDEHDQQQSVKGDRQVLCP